MTYYLHENQNDTLNTWQDVLHSIFLGQQNPKRRARQVKKIKERESTPPKARLESQTIGGPTSPLALRGLCNLTLDRGYVAHLGPKHLLALPRQSHPRSGDTLRTQGQSAQWDHRHNPIRDQGYVVHSRPKCSLRSPTQSNLQLRGTSRTQDRSARFWFCFWIVECFLKMHLWICDEICWMSVKRFSIMHSLG